MSSIINGLFAARAGLQANSKAISVTADNIANANTPGFKASRADFASVLSGSVSSASAAYGAGSRVTGITPLRNQGSITPTGRGLDLAIEGEGFVMLEDSQGSGERFYTRAGNLSVDNEGFVTNQSGLRVLGYSADGGGGLQALNVQSAGGQVTATSEAEVSGNLNTSSAPVNAADLPVAGFSSFEEYSQNAELSTTFDVVDSQGEQHSITTYFYHTSDSPTQEFEYRTVIDGGEVGDTDGIPTELASGTISIGPDGTRQPPAPAVDATISPNYSNGAAAGQINLSFENFTGFAGVSGINSITQDGVGSGQVTGFSVESDGTLYGELDNGTRTEIGTVAVATFSNPDGLERVGDSLFQASNQSGGVVAGTAGSGPAGEFLSGGLEASTTDLATEFIQLRQFEQGFKANAVVIREIDEMLNEITKLGED